MRGKGRGKDKWKDEVECEEGRKTMEKGEWGKMRGKGEGERRCETGRKNGKGNNENKRIGGKMRGKTRGNDEKKRRERTVRGKMRGNGDRKVRSIDSVACTFQIKIIHHESSLLIWNVTMWWLTSLHLFHIRVFVVPPSK